VHALKPVQPHNQGVEIISPAHIAVLAQPIAITLVLASGFWYGATLRAVRAEPPGWPLRRTASFYGGLLLLVAVSCGPLAEAARSAFWVWLSQALALLLIVPVPLMAGQPVELARLSSARFRRSALFSARRWRAFTSPLLGPLFIPLASVVFFFGPVPGWSIGFPPLGWLVQLVLVGLGCIIALPLVESAATATSLAVGAALAVGLVELLLDAIPGIVMRLSTNPVTNYFHYRVTASWSPAWLRDQQIAGGVLWCVAELLDLPFLILVARRWMRADAREAVEVDAALEDQQLRRLIDGEQLDEPWFMQDPQFRDRYS
jgi:putative membrane protein